MAPKTGTIALIAVVAVVLVVGVVAATRLTQATPTPPVSYTATDCVGVGKEYGVLVDTRVRAILSGPPIVNEETRGVQINHAWTNALTTANAYMRAGSITCDGSAFMAAALSQLGPEVRAGVGPTMYVGSVATWEEWIAEVTSTTIDIIDDRPSPS
jgi:hypothetical protein